MSDKMMMKHDGGYGAIGNKALSFMLETLSEDDEKSYRQYLEKQDKAKYKEFVEWEQWMKDI